MKNIGTLVEDIYDVLSNPEKYEWSDPEEFGRRLANVIKNRLSDRKHDAALRMSNFGTKCSRQLWYKVNQSETAEKIQPHVLMKFLYGDVLEEVVLYLAEIAGHTVEGRQDTLHVEGVKGHRDAVIDGVVVDVKSANARGMDKFRNHNLEKDDPFGYLDQLSLYLEGSKDDPKVLVKGEGAFLAIDKEMGHLVLDKYKKLPKNYPEEIKRTKKVLENKTPPERGFSDIPDGKSGNRKLDTECKYCSFKHSCYPGLRTFLYANGPQYLTRVERTPDVLEISKGAQGNNF